QNHVLGGHDNGLAGSGGEDVVGGHHQGAGFQLGLDGEGYVNRPLVTVEVRVEGGAHQGVQLDGLAFNQHRLERLDTQAVEGGRPVEHYRVFANHFVEDVPHHGLFPLDHFLGGLDGGGQAAAFQ